jgi:glycogen debranching enzyme
MSNLHIVCLRPRFDTLYVSEGRTVLATDRDGFISDGADHGLFVHETRLLSRYRYDISGSQLEAVALSNVEQHSWLGYYIALPPGFKTSQPATGEGLEDSATEHSLELRLSRYVGQGVHEDIDLTNYSLAETSFALDLELDADFADQIETRAERLQQGELTRQWSRTEDGVWELAFDYQAEHAYDHQGNRGTARIHRRLVVRVENSDSPPEYAEGHIRFQIGLAPRGQWHACINLIPHIEGEEMPPLYRCRSFGDPESEYGQLRDLFLREATSFTSPCSETLSEEVVTALEQAKRDLADLRLYDLDKGKQAWTMAAGLPAYVALFGRDTLTTAWQSGLVSPDMMRGTLATLADWQGTEINDWRDEQPGRMLHEAHTGPLEMLNYNPRRRYYGSITASNFYPIAVSALWHWTGDQSLIRPLLEPMRQAMRWVQEYSDLDGDGFYEYKTRSTQGSKHQAWKDSNDAIVYEDGSQVEPPIAMVEEQSFAYAARLRAAELLWWLGDRNEAEHLLEQAGEFKKRFNEAFWMEEEGFFAMGLDAQNCQIKAIGSNPGHCLATGIADEAMVRRTAERLFAEDMFSGWGIRTLSSANPAYNPYSYHRGSVWPVEHGSFALGFMRYGLHDLVEKLCRAQFDATTIFSFNRLPEVFSGHQRDVEHPFPALYSRTNIPQAWSASAIFAMVQAMLGLYPYAPLKLLLLDPHLPEWLPNISLRGLRVGDARVTLDFYRQEDGSSDYRILDQQGTLRVIRQPSPWSLTTDFGERVVDMLKSL